MKFIIYFLFTFVLSFFVYYLFNNLKFAAGKINKIGEIHFLVKKYRLDLNELKQSKLIVFVTLIDCFIIVLTSGVLYYLMFNIYLLLIVGVLFLLIQMYIGYMIIFKILIKRGTFNKK